MIEYAALAIVTCATPAPVIDFVTPSPVIEYITPAPAVFCFPPSQELPSAFTPNVAAPAGACAAPAPVIEFVSSSIAAAYAAPAPAIEQVALALAVTYITPAPVIDDVTFSLVIEHIAPAPAVTSVTTDVNLDITSLANPQISFTAVEVPAHRSLLTFHLWLFLPKFPSRSFMPEDDDAEILGHEKAISHYQGHIHRAISDLKMSKEKLQQFDKIQTDLRERLARASRGSRGSPRERRELQDALDEQEVIVRHHHQDVQTSKESLAWAMREIQEKRELFQQFKRRRLGDNSTP